MDEIFEEILRSKKFYHLIHHKVLDEEISQMDDNKLSINSQIYTNIQQYKILKKMISKFIKEESFYISIALIFDKTLNKMEYIFSPNNNLFQCKGSLLFSSRGDILFNNIQLEYRDDYETLNSFITEKVKQFVQSQINKDIEAIMEQIKKKK